MSRVTGQLTADGSTPPITTGEGALFLVASGAFGGGTLTLEVQLTDGTWQALAGAIIGTLSAAGQVLSAENFPPHFSVRATLAGATTPTVDFILRG